jgi:hypothetical protein
LFSSFSSIPKVNLNFESNQFYQDWNSNQKDLELKTLVNNINKHQSNNKYLLDSFEILHWFRNNYLYTHVNSISITEHTIDISLGKTKILFSKDHQEIKLFFNNQIVIKS